MHSVRYLFPVGTPALNRKPGMEYGFWESFGTCFFEGRGSPAAMGAQGA